MLAFSLLGVADARAARTSAIVKATQMKQKSPN
jgi:hypothetical protein